MFIKNYRSLVWYRALSRAPHFNSVSPWRFQYRVEDEDFIVYSIVTINVTICPINQVSFCQCQCVCRVTVMCALVGAQTRIDHGRVWRELREGELMVTFFWSRSSLTIPVSKKGFFLKDLQLMRVRMWCPRMGGMFVGRGMEDWDDLASPAEFYEARLVQNGSLLSWMTQ